MNGDPRHSDHRPVIIQLEGGEAGRSTGQAHYCFKFEARWLQEEGCADLVQKAWLEAFQIGASNVQMGLKDVATVLTDWNQNVLGDLEKRIKKVKKELAACLRANISDAMVQREQVLRYRLGKLEEQKDMYWKQRAHVEWLRQGDCNTSFYHAHTSYRRKINRIKRLQREDGGWVEEDGLGNYIAAAVC